MKPFFFILFLLYFHNGAAQCISPVSVGPNDGSTFANDASTGTVTWSNVSNAQTHDGSYATASTLLGILGSDNSNYLVVTNLGFSLPLFATVCGIKVDIERKASGLLIGSSITDNIVKIVKGGVISGNNLASGSAWPSLDAYASYGGNTNKWGLTWTRDDINSANFGVAVSATLSAGLASLTLTANIDHIRITVYYTPVPVPVKFHSFTAGAEADKINLQWSTSYEYNSHYFVAEKLAETGGQWISVDTVNSHQNSTALNIYKAVDHFPEAENLYRIKEVGDGGAIQYSESVAVSYKAPFHAAVLTYPNPVINNLFVETKSIIEQIQLTDNCGKILFRQKPMSSQLQINTGDLKPGIYFLLVQTKKGATVEKIIKQ